MEPTSGGPEASFERRFFVVSTMLIAILAAVHLSSGEAVDSKSLIDFVSAQQISATASYTRLSYTATVRSTMLEPNSNRPFAQTLVFHYRKRGDSLIVTREASSMIRELEQRKDGKVVDSIYEFIDEPIVKRILITDEYLMLWNDVATPQVDLYYATDWKDDTNGYKQNVMALASLADINVLSFGYDRPFHSLLADSPSFASWELKVSGDEPYILTRRISVSPEKDLRDLKLVVNQRSGLVLRGEFVPGDGSSITWNLSEMEFSEGAEVINVPETFESVYVDDHGIEQEKKKIRFSGFKDEFDDPAFEIEDMGLPDGAEVSRKVSRTKIEPHMWKGGVLLKKD